MDFQLNPEQREIRDLARRFAEREIAPRAAQADLDKAFPTEVHQRAQELGLLGINLPETVGGGGLGCLELVLVTEAFCRGCLGIGTALCVNALATEPIVIAGTDAQRSRYLGAAARGALASFAMTEPGAGSDVAGIRTRAARDGDHWVIDGSKMFITNGVHADLYFVAAKSGPGKREVSMFIVEKGTPGFSVGRALKKTGWLSSDTAELVFDNVRVPASQLLGEEGKGFYSVMKNFQTERIALGAMAVGHCQQALKLTLDYVRLRQAFGGPLWDQQTIRQRLSMLDAKTRAARQFMYHCAWRVTQGHDIVQDVSMLKALTGELVNEVVQTCQQFHGGMGYIEETPIARAWRDIRLITIGGGTSEIMKEIVSKLIGM